MRRKLWTWIGLATFLSAFASVEARPQAPQGDAARIELAAAKMAMMYMPKAADGRTRRGFNPNVVRGDVVSPEVEGVRPRDASVNAFIAQQAGLVLRSPSEVCSSSGCDLRDLGSYLSLSEPRVENDNVVVAVSILTPNERSHAVYEEPYRFGLSKEKNGEWAVRWIDAVWPGLRPARIWIRSSP
jgi:hypothetical protein